MNSRLFFVVFFLTGLINYSGFSQNSDIKMQELLEAKRAFNQANKEFEGYRIQLYNGLSETKARSTLGAFSVFFPSIPSRLIYEQPEWKVQTTTFRSELEAYKVWLKVREEFNGTFVFETKKRE